MLGDSHLLAAAAARSVRAASGARKAMRGVFIILNTPFTATGEVDWDDLKREVDFFDRSGCEGVVWPQGSSGVTTLTRDERLHGMSLLGDLARTHRVTVVLGVQGKDTAEMLEYAAHAERVGADAMIAMPPTTGRSMADYETYFRALGGATRRPIVVQTSGGAKGLSPSVDVIVALAHAFPHMGYVKEESEPLIARMQAELAARPAMKGIFGASLGTGYLGVGAGVIAFQKAQVQRQELRKAITAQLDDAKGTATEQLNSAKDQLAGVTDAFEDRVKLLEERLSGIEGRLESLLAQLEEKLPEQAKDLVKQARELVGRAA